ncbi:MAG: hypothetical protein H3C30_00525 [Candidatus Hydrogenedentes bacterium]|nr:hypothetical protein [Candidatus Hydrogenedentota bacterium]
MPFDHEKLAPHQKRMEFPAVKMPSKRSGHTPAAGEGAAEHGRPESFRDLEQEQEKTLTTIGQGVTHILYSL